ncbi:MAG: hypothetical protein H8E13_08300 [Actinobacteria bacterium]|nr:hypothetical protein [Actinomycetota bacterium]
MKNYYLILQIAHTTSQLMEKGLTGDKIEKVFGSITNVFFKLLEELRTKFFCQSDLERCISKSFQIRFSCAPS